MAEQKVASSWPRLRWAGGLGVRGAKHSLDRELVDLWDADAQVSRQVVELTARGGELAQLLGAHVMEHRGEFLEAEADAARDRLASVPSKEEAVLVAAHLVRGATGQTQVRQPQTERQMSYAPQAAP